jgi:hypothetical protein
MADKKRLQVELSPIAYERLAEAAEEQHTSIAEYVRRAINIELFLQENKSADGTVTVSTPNGATSILLG